MSLSKKTRFEVFKRDGFQCLYCGATPPDAVLEVDHIDPRSKGGKNEINNYLTACFDCNRGKAANKIKILPQNILDHLAQHKEENNHGYIFLNRDFIYEIIQLKSSYATVVYIYLLLSSEYYKPNKGIVQSNVRDIASCLNGDRRKVEEALEELQDKFIFFTEDKNKFRSFDIIVVGYKDKI